MTAVLEGHVSKFVVADNTLLVLLLFLLVLLDLLIGILSLLMLNYERPLPVHIFLGHSALYPERLLPVHQILGFLSVLHKLDLFRKLFLLVKLYTCSILSDLVLLLLFIIVEIGYRLGVKLSLTPEVLDSFIGPRILSASALLEFVSIRISFRLELKGGLWLRG